MIVSINWESFLWVQQEPFNLGPVLGPLIF